MENVTEILKSNIKKSIASNKLIEAEKLICDYELVYPTDIYVHIFRAIILVVQNKLDKAKEILINLVEIDSLNFDINYNLGYICSKKNEFNSACFYYEKALNVCTDLNLKDDLLNLLKDLKPNCDQINKKKIVFFVKQGLDSFLKDIIYNLSDKYEVKKIIVTEYTQIDKEMQWSDICWFEWCDELISYGSKLSIAKDKKIICRLHSYEAFTDYPSNVNWGNIDKVIFVAEHIKNFVASKVSLSKEKLIVIPNGIDLKKWTFSNRKQGFNIAYVGYINYKKGPMLLLHTFKAMYDKNNCYKLFIAGQFQDERDVLYFNHMIKEFGIENNVIFEGWQDDLDKWLENKNFILCTSVLESQNVSVMQAMTKGIKPVIHNFVGASDIYPKTLVWNTINEAVDMLSDKNYISKEYNLFVKNGFEFSDQIEKIKLLLENLYIVKKPDAFDYKSYWNNRLNQKYDIEGVGYLGLGKIYNEFLYAIRYDILNYVLKELMGTLDGKRVLELGPGTGMFTKVFSDHNLMSYCGIDISDKACTELSKKYKSFKFLLGDISENQNYGNEKFDLIFAADVLLHVTDEEKYKIIIKQLSNNISDNGYIITLSPISVINTKSISSHAVIRDLKYVEQILDKNNLELISLLPTSFFMNYPFDKKQLGKNENIILEIFDLIQDVFGSEIISDFTKKQLGKWISTLEKQCLIKNNFGLSQKMLIMKKKTTIIEKNNLSINNIWNITNASNETQILEQELKTNKEIIKYDILEQLKNKIKVFNKKTDQPLVTIGITNYNGKQYLSKCVDSFINQTYPNIEILIIDDCSTDDSDKIIKDYESKYKNINAIYHKFNSGGASQGIQEIISNTRGKYFQWIACDDFVEKDAVDKFVSYLEQNPNKDYVFSGLNVVNEHNIKSEEWNSRIYSASEVVKYIFDYGSGLIPMNCLYRLSFFTNNNINWMVYRNNDFSSDTLNSLQFIKHDWNYGKIDTNVINYRIHANNLSHDLRKRISTIVSVYDYIIKNFDEKVYMPQTKLSQIENKNQFKNYILAQFYYDKIQSYINTSVLPNYVKGNISKEDLIEYCYPLAKEGMKYIAEGLTQGDNYTSQLLHLKEMYNNYILSVKSLGVINL